MSDKYYQILGVTSSSSLEEIKKAFKRRAKELHPDINKSPDAHEQFILLNEAFEYVQNLKTGKVFIDKSQSYTNSKKPQNSKNSNTQREEARSRAEYYAKKSYNEFKRSAYYKKSMEIKGMIKQIEIVLAFIWFFGLLIGGALMGKHLFWAAIFLLITSSFRWVEPLLSVRAINFNILNKAIIYLVRDSTLQMLVLMASSFLIFIFIVLNTLVTWQSVLLSYAIISIVLVCLSFVYGKMKTMKAKSLLFFGIGPFLVNVFFVVNYITSSNPKTESYEYSLYKEYSSGTYSKYNYNYNRKGRMVGTSAIVLDGDVYSEYWGIRFFFDYEKVKSTSRISYLIEDGGLGFRVVKDYKFGYH